MGGGAKSSSANGFQGFWGTSFHSGATVLGKNKKFAFTLAEVLITLGIIGVVAAMTLPTLVQNYRKHVVETRLMKFYSSINQAVQMSEVKNGSRIDWSSDRSGFWDKYLEPYLKYSKVKKLASNIVLVYLPDGSLFLLENREFYFYPEAKNYDGSDNKYGSLGTKSFRFAFYPFEKFDVCKYHQNKGVEPYMCNWDENEKTLYTDTYYGCGTTGSIHSGSYCTALIMRNGWKIPKDYPLKF